MCFFSSFRGLVSVYHPIFSTLSFHPSPVHCSIILCFTLLHVATSVYSPHIHVLQESNAMPLMHRSSQQHDGTMANRLTTRALTTQVAGGGYTKAPNRLLLPLPSQDVLTQPNLVLTISVEGEYANIDAARLNSSIVADYTLLETKLSSIDIEVIAAVVANQRHQNSVVTASNTKRQDNGQWALESTTPSVVRARGTDADVVLRLSKTIKGSKIVGTTSLLVPLSSRSFAPSNDNVALDIGRAMDRIFLYELDLLLSQGPALSKQQVCNTKAPTNVITSVTTLSALSQAQKWDFTTTSLFATTVVNAIMNSWSTMCTTNENDNNMLTLVVSGVVPFNEWSLENKHMNATATASATSLERRRLLADVTVPAPSSNLPAGSRYYNQAEINQYQIKMGAGVIFAVALLLSVCLFCGSTMNYKTDNMLFGQINFKNHME